MFQFSKVVHAVPAVAMTIAVACSCFVTTPKSHDNGASLEGIVGAANCEVDKRKKLVCGSIGDKECKLKRQICCNSGGNKTKICDEKAGGASDCTGINNCADEDHDATDSGCQWLPRSFASCRIESKLIGSDLSAAAGCSAVLSSDI